MKQKAKKKQRASRRNRRFRKSLHKLQKKVNSGKPTIGVRIADGLFCEMFDQCPEHLRWELWHLIHNAWYCEEDARSYADSLYYRYLTLTDGLPRCPYCGEGNLNTTPLGRVVCASCLAFKPEHADELDGRLEKMLGWRRPGRWMESNVGSL